MSNPSAAASTRKHGGTGWSLAATVLGAIPIATWVYFGLLNASATADQNSTLAALKSFGGIVLLAALAIATLASVFALIGALRGTSRLVGWLGVLVGIGSLMFTATYGGGLVT
jgi:uncharacterized membrane protein